MKNLDRTIAALLAVLALVAMAVALVVTLTLTREETDPTPYVAMILGWIGLAIPALGAMFWSQKVSHDIHNQVIVDKVKEGLIEGYPKAIDHLAEQTFKDDRNGR